MQKKTMGCTCVIGSMTQTIRAQRILSAAAIPTETVKADLPSGKRGCSYALSFSCTQSRNVQALLEKNGVRILSFIGGENDDLS